MRRKALRLYNEVSISNDVMKLVSESRFDCGWVNNHLIHPVETQCFVSILFGKGKYFYQ